MAYELNQQLVYTLRDRELRCAVAESCTGGLVAASITDVSGASSVFMGGAVTYTNEMKQKILLVKHETLSEYSAVSPQVATEMATGLRELTGADLTASVTGNAGPEPSEGKPVGTVFLAVASSLGCEVIRMSMVGVPQTRDAIRKAAVRCVLEMMLDTANRL